MVRGILLVIVAVVLNAELAVETLKTAELSCPRNLNCRCNFHKRQIFCRNVSSFQDVPPWTSEVVFRDGDTITLGESGRLPNDVYALYINKYKQVDVRGGFFHIDSKFKVFVLRDIQEVMLSNDVFGNVRNLKSITIDNCKTLRLNNYKTVFKGLKPYVFQLSRVRISITQIADVVCSVDSVALKHVDLSGLDLNFIPKKMADCLRVRELRSLKLNHNNFSRPDSLDSLAKLGHIWKLDVSHSNIKHSSNLGFIKGKNLINLDISNNNLPVKEVKKVLCKLDPKIIKVDASGMQFNYIDDDFFSCLANTSLKYLTLRHGNITGISKHALRYFQNLTDLDLSNNRIPVSDLSFITAARSIVTLQLSRNGFKPFPDFKVNGTCLAVKALQNINLFWNIITTVREEDVQCLGNVQRLTLRGNRINLLPERALWSMKKLRQLSLGRNNMERLGDDSLPTQLIALDLLENNFKSHDLIPIGKLNNLYKFSVSGIDGLWSWLFVNKTKLKSLQISDGKISPGNLKRILQSVKNLEYLRLRSIGIKEIPDEILRLDKLKSLSLMNNELTTIPSHFIPKLNSLKSLGLSLNRFECNCSIMPFVTWLRSGSRSTNVPIDTLACYSPHRYKHKLLFNYEEDCRNQLPIILLSVIGLIVFLIIIMTILGVRYRGYIRYGRMLIRARWRGYGATDGRSFKYDAFVSYNQEDVHWVVDTLRPKLEDDAGYQICLHDRDFTVGEAIVDNIITSIDESRKTILVLSDNFAKSQWCQLEMNLAQHKLFEEDRDIVILIRLGEVAEENVTKTMRMLMRTKTYITWPEKEDGVDLFWKNLIFALRRPPGVVMEEPEWPVGGEGNGTQNRSNVLL